MKKFKHTIFRVEHDEELSQALTDKGNEGYELVNIRLLSEPVYDETLGYVQTMDLIFKKEYDE